MLMLDMAQLTIPLRAVLISQGMHVVKLGEAGTSVAF